MTRRSWFLLLVLSATWGASFLFIDWSLDGLGAPVVVFGRLLVGAATLAVVARPGTFRALRGRWLRLAVFAVFEMVLPYLLIAYGEGRVPSGLASMLVSTQMTWVVLLTPLLAPGSRVRPVALAGVAVGLLGVVALADPFGAGRPDPVGVVLVTAAAVSYAAGALLLGRLLPGVPAVPLTAAGQAVAALLVLPFALANVPRAVPPTRTLVALAVLGIVCTAGGFALFNHLVTRSGPGAASLVSYLAPVFSVAYGVGLAGERLTPAAVLGLVLILAGSALTTVRRRPRGRAVNDGFRPRNAQMASSTPRELRTGPARFSARLPDYVRHRGVRRAPAGLRHRRGRLAPAGVPGVRLGRDRGRGGRGGPVGEAGGQARQPVQGAGRASGR